MTDVNCISIHIIRYSLNVRFNWNLYILWSSFCLAVFLHRLRFVQFFLLKFFDLISFRSKCQLLFPYVLCVDVGFPIHSTLKTHVEYISLFSHSPSLLLSSAMHVFPIHINFIREILRIKKSNSRWYTKKKRATEKSLEEYGDADEMRWDEKRWVEEISRRINE